MVDFTMEYDNGAGLDVAYSIDMDETLEEVFAKFVDMTRIMGYQSGSWDNLMRLFVECQNDATYDMFDWACDTIMRYSILD